MSKSKEVRTELTMHPTSPWITGSNGTSQVGNDKFPIGV